MNMTTTPVLNRWALMTVAGVLFSCTCSSPLQAQPRQKAPSLGPVIESSQTKDLGRTPAPLVDESAILEYVNDTQVPAQADGIIQKIHVEEGAFIEFDQPLFQLDDRLARAALEVSTKEWEAAKEKASDDSNVEFSNLSFQLAKTMLEAQTKVFAKGASSDIELRKVQLEADKARLGMKVAEIQHRTDILTASVNEAKSKADGVQVDIRNIRAPFSGIVAEQLKHNFEFVRSGEIVLRLVGMEKLYVVGNFPANQIGVAPHMLEGAPAAVVINIAPDVPGGKPQSKRIDGTISFVSPVLTSNGSYRVKMLIENVEVNGAWLLREGMDSRLEILLDR